MKTGSEGGGEGARDKNVAASAGESRQRRAAKRRRLRATSAQIGSRWLASAAGAVILIAGLKAASTIIVPVLVASFIAVLSYPLMDGLRRSRMPLGPAVAVTLIADIAILAAAVAMVSASFTTLLRDRATYETRISEYAQQVEETRLAAVEAFEKRGVKAPSWLESQPAEEALDQLDEGVAPDTPWWIEIVNFDAIFGAANRAVRGAVGVLATGLVVLLVTGFMLLEGATFPAKLARAFGHDTVEERVRRMIRDLQRYLGLKTAIGLATGLCVGLWVGLLGLNSPVMWGFLAFSLNYIPNLGSILAAIPAVLFAALQLGPGSAFLVALGYLVVNVVIGNILEPQLLGRRLGLSPLVVFLSLVFWGWVWGPVGMLLSVPITMVLKIGLENTRDFRWVAVLLERGTWRVKERGARLPPAGG